jgi:hypothetical protein
MAQFRAEQIKTLARYDLPAALAREMGNFLATWAYFEYYVITLVWKALELGSEAGRIAVRDPRVTDRLDMLRDLCELYDLNPIDYVLLLDIRKRADPLAAKRHLLAHSLWTYDQGTWCALVTRGAWAATDQEIENYPTGSKAVTPQARAITAKEVAEWTQETIRLIEDIKNINKQHRLVPRPSPKKQRSQSAPKSPTRGRSG